MDPIRIAMMLPGLGRVQRGAETAFIEVARGLARYSDMEVELFGSGSQGIEDLNVVSVPCIRREKFESWPHLPCFRNDTQYEECFFALGLAWNRLYRPKRYDAVISCTYPFVNWYLQRAHRAALGGSSRGFGRGHCPVHVYVTQNGDWPCRRVNREYRWFDCDGLVCINPSYHERHQDRYRTALIPNGVDPTVFRPACATESVSELVNKLAIPTGRAVVLMASAMIPSKRVADGVRAVAEIESAFLLVVGDGPERATIAALAEQLLPNRHQLLGSVSRENMPELYRRADVFLHMSQEEPFGIVYLEAASTGLPVVAHDTSVPRWILGDTALYADTSDLQSVSAALRRALTPSIRSAAGEAGRKRVLADWTWQQQASRYRELILELVAARRWGSSETMAVQAKELIQA